MEYSAIVLAAGSGKRTGLGYNKMFYQLPNGNRIIDETLAVFLNDMQCQQILLVVNPQERSCFDNYAQLAKVQLVDGGKERQDSVNNAVELVTSEIVMIHDGARCYFDEELLARLKGVMEHERACMLAVPAIDTTKIVNDEGYVEQTIDRSTLWLAQTPQVFDTAVIKQAYQQAGKVDYVFSDDASLVEYFGLAKVKIVPSEYYNCKVTTKEDLVK